MIDVNRTCQPHYQHHFCHQYHHLLEVIAVTYASILFRIIWRKHVTIRILFLQHSKTLLYRFIKDMTTKGLASHCKAETTFTFHSSILTLLKAF